MTLTQRQRNITTCDQLVTLRIHPAAASRLLRGRPPAGGAAVSNWAVTGATPANWDPDDPPPNGGIYGPQLNKLKNQYVVMTLGANPLLSYFTNIVFPVISSYDVVGQCVGSTGYSKGLIFPKYYSGPISNAVGCLNQNGIASARPSTS